MEAISLFIFLLIVFLLIRHILVTVSKGIRMLTHGYAEDDDWDHRKEMFTQNDDDFEEF